MARQDVKASVPAEYDCWNQSACLPHTHCLSSRMCCDKLHAFLLCGKATNHMLQSHAACCSGCNPQPVCECSASCCSHIVGMLLGAELVARRAKLLESTGNAQPVLPFGVTLLGPTWSDEMLWTHARSFHEASGLGCGPKGHGVTPYRQ